MSDAETTLPLENEQLAGLSNNEWRIVLITSAGHALCHIAEMIYAGVVVAVMVDLQIGADGATALAVPGFLLFGLGAVPAGVLTDRCGSRVLLNLYFFLVAAAAVLVAQATSPWMWGIALALLGAAISIYHPAGLAMISLGCRNRGRAMGINGVAGSLGVAGGPALGLYMAATYDWRTAYWVLAALALAAGAIACLMKVEVDPPPAQNNTVKGYERKEYPVAVLALLFGAMLVGGFNYRCAMTALPTFLSDPTAAAEPDAATSGAEATVGFGEANQAASLVFIVLAIGGAGQLLGGYLADRFQPALVYAICIAAAAPFALLLSWSTGSATILAASLFAVVLFAQQPLENTMVADATPPQWRSTAYGLKFILAFGFGSVGAYATGLTWEWFDLASVFKLFAGVALLMAGLALAYWWKRR